MLSTVGGILTALGGLLCLLAIVILSKCWLALRAMRASQRASAATPTEKAPTSWESRLRELEADQVSLSSTFEKVARELKRLNSRAGMRELRSESSPEPASAALDLSDPEVRRKHKVALMQKYGVAGKTPSQWAQRQLEIERTTAHPDPDYQR